jgi:tRNA(Arg) A34 adenosine deaminase TadA
MPLPTSVHLSLPAWLGETLDIDRPYEDDRDKVALAIDLARRNVDAQGGGPFGAAIFDASHRILAAAVNRVLPLTCSIAHAETLALMLAQQRLRRARLNRDDRDLPIGRYTLAASSQPCCQCYGATIWGGIDRLLIGARAEDVVAETEFDEGPLPTDWVGELERRGIEVVRDLCRDQARQVLRAFTASGGARY